MAAIYQWLEGGEVVFTTTLYPIDVKDGLQFNMVSNPYGNLSNFPVDNVVGAISVTELELTVLLLIGDTGEDSVEGAVGVTEIELISLLQTGDTGEDSAKGAVGVTELELIDMLVICDTPDESLQLSCITNAANSYLTPI